MRIKAKVASVALVVFFAFVAKEVMASDWKLMGGSQVKKEESFVFYDNESIEYLPNGNIKVWTKSIKTSEINKITKQKDNIEKSASKLLNKYHPPYAIVKESTFDEYVNIISLEEAANNQKTKTELKALSEVDCNQKKTRFLSITVYTKDGPDSSTYEDNKWTHIAPDTNFDTLIKIICPRKSP